jgi:hypothetical protein
MQSTGQTSTQNSSLAPMQGSQITYAKKLHLLLASFVVVSIHLSEMLPLLGQIILGKDRLNRASRLARSAVNALVRVNIQHFSRFEIRFVFTGMNAINRANVHTGCILGPYAGLRYNICHLNQSLLSAF